MTLPKPALVAAHAAARLPRLALLLLCAAYLLPGLVGRDPWRGNELPAFGAMASIARGDSPWWAPTLGGLPSDVAPLPAMLGALSLQAFGPWLGEATAARLPFALLLAAVLAFTWYACYHLARTEAAQPVPFAFGGEARPVDYARALADGGLLALIASLGLLQPGHEATPELMQLAAVATLTYGLAAGAGSVHLPRALVVLALPVLAGSGAPTLALLLAAVAGLVVSRSSFELARGMLPSLLAGALGAVAVASLLGTWGWRLELPDSPWSLVEQASWFLWPGWVLAGWTLWQWRRHAGHRHIALPGSLGLVLVVSWLAQGGSDKALLLCLPATALLAAFALPTLKRGLSAALDWFSVCFFTVALLAIWTVWLSLSLGLPAKPAANVMKLAPGYLHEMHPLGVVAAVLGTLSWLALVRWRTGRHRSVLWKTLVLPAGGVAANWLLVMSLLLPVLDYARSQRPLVERLARLVPAQACLRAPAQDRSLVAALEHHGGWRVEASREDRRRCDWMVLQGSRRPPAEALALPGWHLAARLNRPTDRVGELRLYRRDPDHAMAQR